MRTELLSKLLLSETDVDGALRRCYGDEKMYLSLLKLFPSDETISCLEESINNKKWDDAFTQAHALKGLAGNMGFVPLFHSIGELVILIRTGKINEIDKSFRKVKKCYNEIIDVIKYEY